MSSSSDHIDGGFRVAVNNEDVFVEEDFGPPFFDNITSTKIRY